MHFNTMPKRKDIGNDLRQATAASHQSGKGYNVISKHFWSPSFYREKDYSRLENIQDSWQSSQEGTSEHVTPRADCAML